MSNNHLATLRRALNDDRLTRIPLALTFALVTLSSANRLHGLVIGSIDPGATPKALAIAATCSNLLFVLTLSRLTIIRSRPTKSAEGLAPRLYAFWGTFSPSLLGVLPYADLPDSVRILSIGMVLAGVTLSLLTVRRLGRSFSIVAQSRQLVTGGPYAIVRHPLYVCEQIFVVGIMLDHLSWAAVIIVGQQWYCQLQRMKYEERILRAAFPEYEAYALRTPALIPRISLMREIGVKPQA